MKAVDPRFTAIKRFTRRNFLHVAGYSLLLLAPKRRRGGGLCPYVHGIDAPGRPCGQHFRAAGRLYVIAVVSAAFPIGNQTEPARKPTWTVDR